MFIVWIPVSGKYFLSPILIISPQTFFLFYLPLNLMPYIALVLATPVNKHEMIRFIVIGSLIIFLFNVLIVMLQFSLVSLRLELNYFYAIGRAAIPFILWFAFTYNTVLQPELKSKKENKTKASISQKQTDMADTYQRCPICGKEKKGLEDHMKAVHNRKNFK
jgi:hypothetical protein